MYFLNEVQNYIRLWLGHEKRPQQCSVLIMYHFSTDHAYHTACDGHSCPFHDLWSVQLIFLLTVNVTSCDCGSHNFENFPNPYHAPSRSPALCLCFCDHDPFLSLYHVLDLCFQRYLDSVSFHFFSIISPIINSLSFHFYRIIFPHT